MNAARTSARFQTFSDLSGLLGSAAQYLKARLALLRRETRNAGIRYGIAVALVAGALFVAVLGYVLLVITAVFAVAAAWDWRHAWIVVLGLAALLHLGAAVALLLLARRQIQAKVFAGTIEELGKDHEWLSPKKT